MDEDISDLTRRADQDMSTVRKRPFIEQGGRARNRVGTSKEERLCEVEGVEAEAPFVHPRGVGGLGTVMLLQPRAFVPQGLAARVKIWGYQGRGRLRALPNAPTTSQGHRRASERRLWVLRTGRALANTWCVT